MKRAKLSKYSSNVCSRLRYGLQLWLKFDWFGQFYLVSFPQSYLEALAFETSAYASIIKPLVQLLINEHYSDKVGTQSTESDIVVLEKDLKQTILKVFQQ